MKNAGLTNRYFIPAESLLHPGSARLHASSTSAWPGAILLPRRLRLPLLCPRAESWDALAQIRYHPVQLLHYEGKNRNTADYFGLQKYALLFVAGCHLLQFAKNHSITYVPDRRLFRLAKYHDIINISNQRLLRFRRGIMASPNFSKSPNIMANCFSSLSALFRQISWHRQVTRVTAYPGSPHITAR